MMSLRLTVRGFKTSSLSLSVRILRWILPSLISPKALWTAKSCHDNESPL